jgi:hypothetical protein
MLMER